MIPRRSINMITRLIQHNINVRSVISTRQFETNNGIDMKTVGTNRRRGKSQDRKQPFPDTKERKSRGIDDEYALTHAQSGDLISLQSNTVNFDIPYPKEIVEYLDLFVVGQKLAKKTLAVGVYQHYQRLRTNTAIIEQRFFLETMESEERERRNRFYAQSMPDSDSGRQKSVRKILAAQMKMKESDMMLDKSNIMLLGPSGSGKTFLTMKIAEILDVPYVSCDCTTLTQAGYVGDDVDSIIQKLLVVTDGDIGRAETGIVFLDELDKTHSSSDPLHTSGNRDVGGKGLQQALLKLVEGTTVRVKNPLQPNMKVEVDTTNILFIGAGAFSNLERIVAKRVDKRTLGFGSEYENRSEDLEDIDQEVAGQKKNSLLVEADQEDLIQFGLVPELVGRFPIMVPFHSLDTKMLIEIMTAPRNNIIHQTQRLFEMDGVKIHFTQCALEEVARLAVQRKTGARALRSIIEKILLEAKYECPGSSTVMVEINANVVKGIEPFRKTLRSPSNDSFIRSKETLD